MPDLRETAVGVNATFNEVVPSYAEEYYNELDKLKFEVAPDESTVESFQHLVGKKYLDDDTFLEFVTTRVVEYMKHIVAFRAPVLAGGKTGREEKSPIHVADVIRMSDSNSRGRGEVPATELNARLGVKSGLGVKLSRGDFPATESDSRPGVGSGHRDEPGTVGVNTAEHKATAARYGARAGVISGSVESFATMNSKRMRFVL
jgi:hypothetical protein